MSQFRAKTLDIDCFTKIRNIRDHTKRKVYAEHEPERYAPAGIDCLSRHTVVREVSLTWQSI